MKTLTTKQAIIIAAVGLAGIYGIKKAVAAVRKYKDTAKAEAGLAPETTETNATNLSFMGFNKGGFAEDASRAADCCERASR